MPEISSNPILLLTFHFYILIQVTPERCLSLSMQLIDVIEIFLEHSNIDAAVEYQMYLLSLADLLIEFGNDPRNIFNTTLKTIQMAGGSIDNDHVDYMLITMSQIIHNIVPFYLPNALGVIEV